VPGGEAISQGGKCRHPAPWYLSTSAPGRHLQPLFHYLNCFSQNLTVKFKEQNLGIKFHHKVLRKAVKIVEKWLKVLKVPKVLIVKRAEGGDWVPTGCRGAEQVLRYECAGCQHLPPCYFTNKTKIFLYPEVPFLKLNKIYHTAPIRTKTEFINRC
jgi:hypothetical protein